MSIKEISSREVVINHQNDTKNIFPPSKNGLLNDNNSSVNNMAQSNRLEITIRKPVPDQSIPFEGIIVKRKEKENSENYQANQEIELQNKIDEWEIKKKIENQRVYPVNIIKKLKETYSKANKYKVSYHDIIKTDCNNLPCCNKSNKSVLIEKGNEVIEKFQEISQLIKLQMDVKIIKKMLFKYPQSEMVKFPSLNINLTEEQDYFLDELKEASMMSEVPEEMMKLDMDEELNSKLLQLHMSSME